MSVNDNQSTFAKQFSNDFQTAFVAHRENVTAADSAVPSLSPGGWAGFDCFLTGGAVTVEMRCASNVDSGATKSLLIRVFAWPYEAHDATLNDNRGGLVNSAGVLILDTALATSGEVITGHPFGGTPNDGPFFMADQEGTIDYEVDEMLKRYPNTPANAATHELRYLIDTQGYQRLYVIIDGVPSASRAEVGLRRVG